ncbi:alpha/beta fold hydrolase [Aspergillus undulatus]|uniref:alpha/beta fold hydrolase n=1 Tax=Aspergillus undulatus TaxID=1810928 RepID=UPI003CCD89BF
MTVDKINVLGDSRVEHRSAFVNGKTYGYLYCEPESKHYKGTVVLLHGFPDLSMGWRYQIPLFTNKGYRVIAPDCLGYGRTDAPSNLTLYSHKSHSADIAALCAHLSAPKIILGGHDWGAYLAYRVALWYPELVSHLFTVCVPYAAPQKKYHSIEEMVKTVTPHFAYQLQFVSGEIVERVRDKEGFKQFLVALYGGRTEGKEFAFDVNRGVDLGLLGRLKKSWLLSDEELEYYAWEFTRHGLQGPLNWYRTRKINYDDELALSSGTINVPVLFIKAVKDAALPPHLGRGMAKHLPRLRTEDVDASHWVLWERPAEVNGVLERWLDEVVEGEGEGRVVKL